MHGDLTVGRAAGKSPAFTVKLPAATVRAADPPPS